ncbi:hypothetical protein B566_EDAN012139 [Ephemera danica]|nr:hypothetical protein B566_EDAN012139 [Ephemera danica]
MLVNFSPSWGKRGSSATGGAASLTGGSAEGAACRSSMEALLYIYKLVQNEAQKLISCSGGADKFAD